MTDKILKPCPFCGSESLGKITIPADVQVREEKYYVYCNKCFATGPMSKNSIEEAVEKWNTLVIE